MFKNLLGLPVLALVVKLPAFGHNLVGAAHHLYIERGGILRRQGEQGGGIAIPESQVALDDGAAVVLIGPVVAPGEPLVLEARGRFVDVVDLIDGDAVVGQIQDLVVEIGVHVPFPAQHFLNAFGAPTRPAMGLEEDLGRIAPLIEGDIDVLGPGEGVTHRGAPQGEDVVEAGDDVFSQPEGVEVGEPGIHFGRGFRAGRILEDHMHPVDFQLFDGLHNDPGGRQDADVAHRHGFADGHVDVAEGAGGQGVAIGIDLAPHHGGAGIEVLGDGFLHEALGGKDLHLAGLEVGVTHHAPDAAEVVGVGVRDNDRHHRPRPEFLVDKFQGGPGGFLHGQGIDDDPAGFALDEGDDGQVVTPHLVDAGSNLVQAETHVQDRLSLQRRVDAVEVLALQQEVVAAQIPGHATFIILDHLVIRDGDEAMLGLFKIPLVGQR